jgi:type II secretory pathway component PulF
VPTFSYQANDRQGQSHKGQVEALDLQGAHRELERQQLFPLQIKPKSENPWGLNGLTTPSYQEDVVLLTRQFSTLLITGVPISEALEALALELEGKAIQSILLDIRDQVNQGKTLFEAMAAHPQCFTPVYLGLIKVGEASGNMADVLRELSTYLLSQEQLKKKITGALTYPIVLCGIGSLVVGILVTTVIPTIANVLKDGGQTLPTSTQLLMNISEIMTSLLPWSPLFLGLLIYGWRFIRRHPTHRLTLDRQLFKAPIIGSLLKKAHMARFSMTFSIMLRSGVPALEALDILEGATENLALRQAVCSIKEGILGGKDISTQVKKENVFPPLMSFMISMGEKSGKLDEVLTGVSEHYKEEIEHEISKFTKAFEPAMIVVMATVIGLIVYSVVSAILEMSNVS